MRVKTFAITILAATYIGVSLVGSGCASHQNGNTQATPVASTEKSGAQLWTDNCRRCHYLRGPETYSPSQWEVAVHHMRLRANLTGEEARKVTAFLKSAS